MFRIGMKIQDGHNNTGIIVSINQTLPYPIKVLFDKFASNNPSNFDYFSIDGRKPSCQTNSKQNIKIV